jgi:uncharacterized protein with FMN-binding domain
MDKSILTKFIILLFAITILGTVLNSCNSNDKNSMGKFFSGKAEGYGGDVTVRISVRSDGYMETIHIKAPKDDPERINVLIPSMAKQIIEEQSLTVDSITGSTVTYNGILEATKKALEKGGFDAALYEHVK